MQGLVNKSHWRPAEPGQSAAWLYPPDLPTLGSREVHLWLGSLNQSYDLVAALAALLSPDERAKADRFVFDVDRRKYTVARGCLRTILSRYLQIDPETVGFAYGDYGKPALTSHHGSALSFNLAHSGELVIYALTLIGEVGIDLERIKADFAVDEVARKFFSPGEVLCLDQFQGPARDLAFFRCWTRKEAFIKGKRMGLSLALDQFEVSLTSKAAALVSTLWDGTEAARWSLQDIEVEPGYVAALAIEAHDYELSRFLIQGV